MGEPNGITGSPSWLVELGKSDRILASFLQRLNKSLLSKFVKEDLLREKHFSNPAKTESPKKLEDRIPRS